MMNKLSGRLMIAAGTLLLIAAVSLVLYNRHADAAAGERADKALAGIKQYIERSPDRVDKDITADLADIPAPEPQPFADDAISQEGPEQPTEEEPALELDGRYYIAYITIPKLGLELPVQRGYVYEALEVSPCRYSGSVASGDLVIAGHNYTRFFKRLNELSSGDEIIYTSLSGSTRRYEVGWSELISGDSRDLMLSGSDDWDMTLFTCTWSGYSRVTVRCIEEFDSIENADS